jgi:hypothetical protein
MTAFSARGSKVFELLEGGAVARKLEGESSMSLRNWGRRFDAIVLFGYIMRDGKEATVPLLRWPMQFQRTRGSRVALKGHADSGLRVSAGALRGRQGATIAAAD